MKKIFALLILPTAFLPIRPQAQNWQIAKRFSATSGSLTNTAAATAPDGSTYVVGGLSGTVNFDGVALTAPPGSPAIDGYLLKLDAGLQAQWATILPVSKTYDVAVDANGQVFVAGALWSSAEPDSASYVAKYSPAGQLLAEFTATGSSNRARRLATDAAGNCYVAGWLDQPATFGGVALQVSGERDAYLLRLSPDLSSVDWVVKTGVSTQLDEVYDLKIDDAGYLYTTGNFSQEYNFFSCACWNGDFFVEKRQASDGALVWQNIYSSGSGSSTQQFAAVTPDGAGVFTATSFKNTTTPGPGLSLTASTGNDDYHLFVAQLDPASGAALWAEKVALAGDNYLTGMVLHADTLALHGRFVSTTIFGAQVFTPQGAADAFFVGVSPADGSVLHAEAFFGPGNETGNGLSGDFDGLVVSGGSSSSALHLGAYDLPGTANSIYVARDEAILTAQIIAILDASCFGVPDGQATVGAQGGTPPYTYAWDDGETTAGAIGLSAGNHSVTVTDSQGQAVIVQATVGQPPALTLSVQNAAVSPDLNGWVTVTPQTFSAQVFNACGNVQISASPPIPDSFSCADIGSVYPLTLTVTDEAGNSASATAQLTVVDLTAPELTCPVAIARCADNSVVIYDAPVATDNCLDGGSWALLEGLPSGADFPEGVTTQVYAYTDAGGNVGSCSFEVVILPGPAVANTLITPENGQQGNGRIELVLGAGASPFTFVWSQNGQAIGGNSAILENLHSDFYDVLITDANGCTTALTDIFVDNLIAAAEPAWLQSVRLAPNPANASVRVLNLPANGAFTVQVLDVQGRVMAIPAESGDSFLTLDCARLPAGAYRVLIRGAQGSGWRNLMVSH